MKRKALFIGFIFISVLSSWIGAKQAYAYPPVNQSKNFIKNVTVRASHACGQPSPTSFTVEWDWGSACKLNGEKICERVSGFRCQTHGKACTTTSAVTSVSVSKNEEKSNKTWDYYNVTLNVNENVYQRVGGGGFKIRKDKSAALELYLYDESPGHEHYIFGPPNEGIPYAVDSGTGKLSVSAPYNYSDGIVTYNMNTSKFSCPIGATVPYDESVASWIRGPEPYFNILGWQCNLNLEKDNYAVAYYTTPKYNLKIFAYDESGNSLGTKSAWIYRFNSNAKASITARYGEKVANKIEKAISDFRTKYGHEPGSQYDYDVIASSLSGSDGRFSECERLSGIQREQCYISRGVRPSEYYEKYEETSVNSEAAELVEGLGWCVNHPKVMTDFGTIVLPKSETERIDIHGPGSESINKTISYQSSNCAFYEEERKVPGPIAYDKEGTYGDSNLQSPTIGPDYTVNGTTYSFLKWANCNNEYVVNGFDLTVPTYNSDGSTYCTAYPMLRDRTLVAIYAKKHFAGRAYATGQNGSSDTGFIENKDATSRGSVDCLNEGCNVDFGVDLKTLKSRGETTFTTSTTPTKSSPIRPSTEGEQVGKASQTIIPGQEACRYIRFYPFGPYSDSTTRTATACISAKVTNFKANISVSGSASGSTDWTGNNKTVNTSVKNCSPVTGCKISFNHKMKKTDSIGTTNYVVSRTSNLTGSGAGSRALPNVPNLASGKFNADINQESTIKDDNNLTVYPGMRVCETVTFKPHNNQVNKASNVGVTLCVNVEGNAQPDDPPTTDKDKPEPENPDDPNNPEPAQLDGAGAFINIKVRNQDVARWNKYQRSVYARPGNKLYYRSSYNPVLQYTYYLRPLGMKINGGNNVNSNGSTTLGTLFNNSSSNLNLQRWNNGYSIYKDILDEENKGKPTYISNHRFNAGLVSKQSPAANSVTVQPENAGRKITETATSSHPEQNDVKTTPRQVSFDANNIGDIDIIEKSETANAFVPYNFIINTEIASPNPDDKKTNGSPSQLMFAGEKTTITYNVSVDKKTNSLTTDGSSNQSYATLVRNSRSVLVVYYPDKVAKKNGGTINGGIDDNICSRYFNYGGNDDSYCGIVDNGKKDLNPGVTPESKPFLIQDLPAGSEICVASAAFPASSGSDDNWNNLNYDGKWRVSDSKCYKIAKRPSIQAWGGNVYSGGAINSPRAVKRNLAGKTGYNLTADQGTFVFGSWGDSGVIARGQVGGFASGGTLGYASNNGNGDSEALSPNPFTSNALSIPSPGGSTKDNFCFQSVLTFANSGCASGWTDGAGEKDATEGVAVDLEAIKSLAQGSDKVLETNSVYIESGLSSVDGQDDGYIMYRSSDNMTLTGGNLAKGTFKIVSAKNNVNITGDIRILDGETFETFRQVPKAVIYADNAITIGCNVTHLDALLVADKVITCGDEINPDGNPTRQINETINRRNNSNQLRVNGAIVAGKLYANRTYGAATGTNSMVPAEIIDFDPTLYLWGGMAGSGAGNDDNNINGNMEITYLKELAPRY